MKAPNVKFSPHLHTGRLKEGSLEVFLLKFWIMYLLGGVDQCIGRYLSRLSIDISTAISVDSQPSVGREYVNISPFSCQSSISLQIDRQSVDIGLVMCR